ncbi:hypothetical protein OTB20_37975 [Streptomyces sp. H27-H1]|uniref:hypothetical protein n=1 Tax=Streptomyces sp. H27-H1 TaxID=2996461 RepID=UPI002270C1F0|nr:hypothetical protein [Streptomyces sp. H27-H1]MCY0931866.1 hypothetical protein [Streptomyces sp. H27-H1]
MENSDGRLQGRRGVGVRPGAVGGMTVSQAAVVCVVLVLAAVMRLYGKMPMTEIFQLLGGAAGIGMLTVFTLTPGGRGIVAAAVRGALQAGR